MLSFLRYRGIQCSADYNEPEFFGMQEMNQLAGIVLLVNGIFSSKCMLKLRKFERELRENFQILGESNICQSVLVFFFDGACTSTEQITLIIENATVVIAA